MMGFLCLYLFLYLFPTKSKPLTVKLNIIQVLILLWTELRLLKVRMLKPHTQISECDLIWRQDLYNDVIRKLPQCLSGKESACNCNAGDPGSVSASGRSPGVGHGNPLQHFCLENPHKQRSLAGYSAQGCKESEWTEATEHTRMHARTRSSGQALIHCDWHHYKNRKFAHRQGQMGDTERRQPCANQRERHGTDPFLGPSE